MKNKTYENIKYLAVVYDLSHKKSENCCCQKKVSASEQSGFKWHTQFAHCGVGNVVAFSALLRHYTHSCGIIRTIAALYALLRHYTQYCGIIRFFISVEKRLAENSFAKNTVQTPALTLILKYLKSM